MKHDLLLFVALIVILTACTTNDPAQTAQAYFQAVVGDDQERLGDLVCAAQEREARAAAASFRGTGASLENLQCETIGTDGTYQIVRCLGRIVMNYQGEQRQFALASYRMIQENNAWRWCGEAG